MKIYTPKKVLFERARAMRREPSYAEKVMWILLRKRQLAGYRFRRQHVIDCYIVDFVCVEKKVVLELDGDSHQGQMVYDAIRTRHLMRRGFRVCRVTNDDLLGTSKPIFKKLLKLLEEG